MMKAGTETGSLMNHLASRQAPVTPEVGMGVTFLGWTDRHAGTIVKILSPTRIQVQQDLATRTDSNGMSEAQTYEFAPNPSAPVQTFSLRKDGGYKKVGGTSQLLIGKRSEYYDYSF